MKKNSVYLRFLVIGLFCSLSAYFLSLSIFSKTAFSINDFSAHYRYSFSKQKKALSPLKIVGIAIDENSLSRISQRWPFKRSLYAQVIKILDKEKVHTVGFDFVLSGESEDKQDDLILKEALANASARVVLAYLFDYQKKAPIFPLKELKESAYSLGMLNTPQDKDGIMRRLRSYVAFNDQAHYSFSLALSAAYLEQNPDEIIARLPLLPDRTFFINYLLKAQDIIIVSFSDILENPEKLKERHGDDFLKDSLALIYPAAEIMHDTHLTPLGRMPGALLHLNGVMNIASGHFIREAAVLSSIFLFLALFLTAYFLTRCGFLTGLLFTLGSIFLIFWILVGLGLNGIKFDYAQVVIFTLLFFTAGSLYKYLHSLLQLLSIKNKTTLDPLRGIYTLRYFYYRLQLERAKFYFNRDLYLVFIYLESFNPATEGMSLDELKKTWQEIQAALALSKGFWSVYSPEEIIGCVLMPSAKAFAVVNSIKNKLAVFLKENNIQSKAKAGYIKFKKEHPIKEALLILSEQLRKSKDDLVSFEGDKLFEAYDTACAKTSRGGDFLEMMGEDVEEKNRQLLSYIDSLNKEHQKTKEAFFQIITSLVHALEARDPYTEGHSQRVAKYALLAAERLGWDAIEKEKLRKASLLHDLGKIGIPDAILHKKGSLTNEEYEIIKKHEVIGVRILEPLKDMSEIFPWILYHHEKWDGKGYPHGLGGSAIPEGAQIISLADVYDALTTGRDYKVAFSQDAAVNEILKGKGSQFNPPLADIFVSAILEGRLPGK